MVLGSMPDSASPPSSPMPFLSFDFSVFVFTLQLLAEKISGAKLMHSAALLEAKGCGKASLCLKNGYVESWHLPGTVPAHQRRMRSDY